ncbi:MAG: hypothetical protein AAFQ09_01360 [Pseudomonadota bacterium]
MIPRQHVLPFFVVIAAMPAIAQTIDQEMVNGYFAPVVVIADHPQCNGTGQTAFELTLEAAEMDFDLRGVDGDNIVYVGDDRWGEVRRQRCFVTQRRGVDSTPIEIPCEPNLSRAEFQERMDGLSVSVNF